MPSVRPFRALRPRDPAATLAPPYDVIDAAQRSSLQASSPANLTHLTLPEGEPPERYVRANEILRTLERDGSLTLDVRSSFTVYEQTVGGRTVTGVLAATELAEPGVLPHERTYDRIVEDRLELLRATECNLEPVFLLAYGAPDLPGLLSGFRSGAALLDCEVLEARHRAWRVDDPDLTARFAEILSAATLVIADGHHRWTTAQRYAREHGGPGPAGAHLTFIADADAGGVALLPIHRAVPGVSPDEILAAWKAAADAEAFPGDLADLAHLVIDRRPQGRVFGLWGADGGHLIVMRDRSPLPGQEHCLAWRDLDVSVLHEVLLRGLGEAVFAHSPEEAAHLAGASGSAILLAPAPMRAVLEVAQAGETMPQKSTLFVPKPASGVVLRPLLP